MSGATATVDILLFEVGPHLYATDASQVLRIDKPDDTARPHGALGPLKVGDRALVFDRGVGEEQLIIDGVLGLRSVSVDALRKLPNVAESDPCAIGVWLNEHTPVVLLDLWKTPTFEGRQ